MGGIIFPIMHLNGDRPETLTQALHEAYVALGKAQKALTETAPNARNYYPQPGLFPQAVLQYQRRMEILDTLRKELLTEYNGIQAQAPTGA